MIKIHGRLLLDATSQEVENIELHSLWLLHSVTSY